MFLNFILTLLVIFIVGCMMPLEHQQVLNSTQERELTLGIVQKEIKIGMSQAEVVELLGSPNIITRDSEGKETWVYDKITIEATYSISTNEVGAGVGGGGVPGTSLILGIITGGFSRESGAIATTQKTLTVIIRFDENKKVSSFLYHASKF